MAEYNITDQQIEQYRAAPGNENLSDDEIRKMIIDEREPWEIRKQQAAFSVWNPKSKVKYYKGNPFMPYSTQAEYDEYVRKESEYNRKHSNSNSNVPQLSATTRKVNWSAPQLDTKKLTEAGAAVDNYYAALGSNTTRPVYGNDVRTAQNNINWAASDPVTKINQVIGISGAGAAGIGSFVSPQTIGALAGLTAADEIANRFVYQPLSGSRNHITTDVSNLVGVNKIKSKPLRAAAQFGIDMLNPTFWMSPSQLANRRMWQEGTTSIINDFRNGLRIVPYTYLNYKSGQKVNNNLFRKLQEESLYKDLSELRKIGGSEGITVPMNGESYFRAELGGGYIPREYGGKNFTKYSDNENYFISYGLPWEEHQTAPIIYEFPLKTFGELDATNSKGMVRKGTSVVDQGRKALQESSIHRIGRVHDPIFESYTKSPRFGNIDREPQFSQRYGWIYNDDPEYLKLHLGNQTTIPGSRLKDALLNTEYKVWKFNPEIRKWEFQLHVPK